MGHSMQDCFCNKKKESYEDLNEVFSCHYMAVIGSTKSKSGTGGVNKDYASTSSGDRLRHIS